MCFLWALSRMYVCVSVLIVFDLMQRGARLNFPSSVIFLFFVYIYTCIIYLIFCSMLHNESCLLAMTLNELESCFWEQWPSAQTSRRGFVIAS